MHTNRVFFYVCKLYAYYMLNPCNCVLYTHNICTRFPDVQLRPDLNSQKIYFFPCMNVHEEGILLYDQKDNLYYVHDILSGKKFYTFFSWISFLRDSKKLYKGNRSPLVTIFLKPDPFSANISSILREKEQKYFKRKEILSVKEFQTRIQQRVHENSLYASVIIKEISGGVELMEI